MITPLTEYGIRAKKASTEMALLSSDIKSIMLVRMADEIRQNKADILNANNIDVTEAKEKGISTALLDRLTLTDDRVESIAKGLEDLAALLDPIGEVLGFWKAAQDLEITKVRVPIGVIGIIYEARPNVTADAAGICFKTGNAVILRGSGEAINSNKAIVKSLTQAVSDVGGPDFAIQLLEDTSRTTATEFMKMNKYMDLLIPRGGAKLIETVVREATVPIIETGTGNCHIFVDVSADIKNAVDIVINAKTQRPGVCNSVETLLVHKNIASKFLPFMSEALKSFNVEIRACAKSQKYFSSAKTATEEDYYEEYLDLILAVKIVEGIEEAILHINTYGTSHTEAILTNDCESIERFPKEVDAAVVLVNASTRFTDGGIFGFGAEIGISTQKLHARGPMGLEAMTSIKYIIKGEGQVRL
ncbi:MAG: glutamate-5-semialdehyde dehydrogenase [Oscillospiraceae bacterium]|jgi:glutamate-5-semialdehyde dehydrogenase|nr:glutamate-5-semialdehyde dehydrogenase [Oscillospiraceae bacterium]